MWDKRNNGQQVETNFHFYDSLPVGLDSIITTIVEINAAFG